jgi:hypothetical protein
MLDRIGAEGSQCSKRRRYIVTSSGPLVSAGRTPVWDKLSKEVEMAFADHTPDEKKSGHVGKEHEPCPGIEEDRPKKQYTIKGIEGRTVELMRFAARKEGMKVGAWVAARLQEAADRALKGEDNNPEIAELREHIRRIEDTQREEQERLVNIQSELTAIVRSQNSIMACILSKA